MTKIIKIETCDRCPYLRLITRNHSNVNWCRMANKEISLSPFKETRIPSWCPLEDLNDAEETERAFYEASAKMMEDEK